MAVSRDDEQWQALAERAARGDRIAFDDLVRQTMESIVALTYRMTGDREVALDIAQDTFVTAWERLKDFRQEARVTSWLYRIAINKTLNHLSRRRAEPLPDEAAFGADTVTPDVLWRQERLRRGLTAFLARLPEQQRLAFELRFYQGLSFQEMAAVTGKALGTVKTNYRQAVQKLRKHALEQGWIE